MMALAGVEPETLVCRRDRLPPLSGKYNYYFAHLSLTVDFI